jgi:hypothetical protein
VAARHIACAQQFAVLSVSPPACSIVPALCSIAAGVPAIVRLSLTPHPLPHRTPLPAAAALHVRLPHPPAVAIPGINRKDV